MDKKGDRRMKLYDLKGQRFGRLTVVDRDYTNRHKGVYWKCRCDCGNISSVLSCALVSGHTKSCGCIVREMSSIPKSHGLCNTKEHAIWKAMRQRCNNSNASNYKYYGGRGIKVCKEWDDFSNFYEWCNKNGFKEGLTLDRIDTNGDYCPENCRWADALTQCNNKRNNHKVKYNGAYLSLMQLERLSGIGHSTIGYRLKSGWTVRQAVSIMPKYGNKSILSHD